MDGKPSLTPLVDSADDWTTQTQRLVRDRAYGGEEAD